MTMPHSKQMPVMCCTACVDMSQGRHGTDVIGQTPGTVPTLLLLVSQMRKFAVIEREREQNFGKLIQQWLAGMLPDIQLQHQTQGERVVDIQLFVKVGVLLLLDGTCQVPCARAAVPAWAPEGWDSYTQRVSLLQAAALGVQWLQDHVTLIYMEVKREAGFSGDAQPEGMVYYANDCQSLAVAGTKTLQPALLLTVSTRVSLPCASWLQAMLQSLCFLASASCVAGKCLAHPVVAVQQLYTEPCEAVTWLLCNPSPQAGVVLLQAGESADKHPQGLSPSPCSLLQVVGPTVQAFGLCLTESGTIVCKPLTAAMDMLLIPHHVHRFEELVSFFRELLCW